MKKAIVVVLAVFVAAAIAVLSIHSATVSSDTTESAASDIVTQSLLPAAMLPTTATTVRPAPAGSEEEIFDSGRFYLTGTLKKGSGGYDNVVTAVDGSKMSFEMNYRGMDVRLLNTGEKYYLICPGKQIYVELSPSLLDMMDIDVSKMSLDVTEMGAGGEVVSTSTESTDDGMRDVHEINVSDGKAYRYYDGARLTRIDNYNTDGSFDSSLRIDTITDNIPDGLLDVPDGYTSESIYRFMKYFVSEMNQATEAQ